MLRRNNSSGVRSYESAPSPSSHDAHALTAQPASQHSAVDGHDAGLLLLELVPAWWGREGGATWGRRAEPVGQRSFETRERACVHSLVNVVGERLQYLDVSLDDLRRFVLLPRLTGRCARQVRTFARKQTFFVFLVLSELLELTSARRPNAPTMRNIAKLEFSTSNLGARGTS